MIANTQLSDEAIVARLAVGDTRAFPILVQRYRGRIYAVLMRATGQSNDADDLFQETWIRVARGASSFDPSRPFASWVSRIATHAAIDWMRARGTPSGRACPACAGMLRVLAAAIAPGTIRTATEPTQEVETRAVLRGQQRARRGWAIANLINITLSVSIVALWMIYVEWGLSISSTGGVRAMPVTSIVTGMVFVVGYLSMRGLVRDGQRERLYARWNGRWLQGICTGLAEYFRIPVWAVRTFFIALFLGGLGGGTIYFLLAFVVLWHPDDRHHMTWFRFRRWWRRHQDREDGRG